MTLVSVVEVCPRDGLQNERTPVSPHARAQLVVRSLAAGATRVEAVSFVNEAQVPQMAGAEQVLSLVREQVPYARLAGLVLNQRGLQRALAAEVAEVNLVVPCTNGMSLRNQGMDVAAMVREVLSMAAEARSAGAFVTLTVAVAFGCPFEGEVPVDAVRRVLAEAVNDAIDEVALADTIGVGVPTQVESLAAVVEHEAPGLPQRYHFHNTRNTGYANASAAVALGVANLDASTGGFGGCPFAPAATGNIATEDLVYLLERSGHRTEIDGEQVSATAAWLGGLLGTDPTALLGRAGHFPSREQLPDGANSRVSPS
jgi:hydroxymethylglutaryl-CoA lyase